MTRFIGISDLHLDAVTYGVPRMEEIDRSVRAQLDVVQEGDVVVFAGDLGNPGSPRIYEAISLAIQYDRFVKDRDAEMVWLVGNHDVLEDGSGGSVLEPLRGYGALVFSEPAVRHFNDVRCIFLPHAPLARRYSPDEFLNDSIERTETGRPTIVIGHLNPPGITPGSEAEMFARGRDVLWPEDRPVERSILYVGGHIHRAQEFPKRAPGAARPWGSIQIIGAPVRFDFGEADFYPLTFVAEWDGEDWYVERKPVQAELRLFETWEKDNESRLVHAAIEGDEMATAALSGCFIRSPEDLSELCKRIKSTFVPLPKLAVARPKANVAEGARRHRRVRDVVTDIAKSYPTYASGLAELVEETMTENDQ